MKRKVTSVGTVKDSKRHLSGIRKFRITGPCEETGVRVVLLMECTRKEAETVRLIASSTNLAEQHG